MVLLARRLPPGLLRDVLEFLPACVATARALRGDPAVLRRAKVALLFAVLWALSPVDLLPEFLPVIGPFDDVVAVVLLMRFAARSGPRPVIAAAWPGPLCCCGGCSTGIENGPGRPSGSWPKPSGAPGRHLGRASARAG